jgi:UDP-N-acetylmuramoyl-L-alanyl-D-glutamate--2,6-diaminopimelate ligase
MSRAISLRTLLEGWCTFDSDTNEDHLAVSGLRVDAGSIEPGDAYVAIAQPDGHGIDWAAQAACRGAAVVLHDGAVVAPRLDIPVLAVPGLEARLGELGARFHRHPAEQLTLAGVTGGRGKTSTTHFIAQSWQRATGGAGMVSDLGHGPLCRPHRARAAGLDGIALHGVLSDCLRNGVERMVLEFSPRLLEPSATSELGFDALVFTASGTSGEADPLRVFADEHPRFAVVNHDDPAGKELSRRIANGTQVLTFGTNGATELRGTVLGMDASGMTVRIAGPWGGGEVRTGLLGAFNLSNLLGAVGVLALLGMPWNQVMHQVEIMQAAPGRLHPLGGDAGQPVVVLDEASSATRLEETLTALRSHLHGRLVCVFGCDAAHDRAERQAMASVAEALSDRVVMTLGEAADENPWAIFEDMAQGLRRFHEARVIGDRAEAIRSAIEESRAGDIVLVAGRGAERWSEAAGRAVHDDDAATVRGLLEEAA